MQPANFPQSQPQIPFKNYFPPTQPQMPMRPDHNQGNMMKHNKFQRLPPQHHNNMNNNENDVLIIPCADSYPESELTVYNRWGSVVYNERNYKNKWKGTYNGDLLPAGTYYYTYKLKPSDSKCKVGYVTIVRD